MADITATLTDRSITRQELERLLGDTTRIGQLLHDRYAVWPSSGTSGQPAALRYADANGAQVDLLPLVLTTVMEEEAGIYDFQLRQTDAQTLTVALGSQANAARGRRVLRAFLARSNLPHVHVHVDPAGPARDRPSGKLRRIVCTGAAARERG